MALDWMLGMMSIVIGLVIELCEEARKGKRLIAMIIIEAVKALCVMMELSTKFSVQLFSWFVTC